MRQKLSRATIRVLALAVGGLTGAAIQASPISYQDQASGQIFTFLPDLSDTKRDTIAFTVTQTGVQVYSGVFTTDDYMMPFWASPLSEGLREGDLTVTFHLENVDDGAGVTAVGPISNPQPASLSVPEPLTLGLLGGGLAAIGVIRSRRNSAKK
jgi:hypothetical protein